MTHTTKKTSKTNQQTTTTTKRNKKAPLEKETPYPNAGGSVSGFWRLSARGKNHIELELLVCFLVMWKTVYEDAKQCTTKRREGGLWALLCISKADAFALKNAMNEWRICWMIPMPGNSLTEKMHHFCSAPLFGSFLTLQPIPVSALHKHLANTSSSPLLPSFSSQNALLTPAKGWRLSLLTLLGSGGGQNQGTREAHCPPWAELLWVAAHLLTAKYTALASTKPTITLCFVFMLWMNCLARA